MSQAVSITNYTPAARYDDEAWKEVLVEEGATSSGTWTLIDTLTLDPVDNDPADPQARNLTTLEASDTPGLWYRFTPRDEDGNTGQPSAPIQNTVRPGAFATSDDLATRLGVTLTAAEASRADTLLELATGLIQRETGQTITLVESDELLRRSVAGDRLRLPQRPVVSIDSVTLTPPGGVAAAVDAESYYLDGDELVRATFPLLSQRFFGQWTRGWLGPLWQIDVVYTHGFETIPALAKAVCVETVVRVWGNPGSVIQESIGDTNTTYAPFIAPPRGLLLTDDEKSELNQLLRRQSGSVTLR